MTIFDYNNNIAIFNNFTFMRIPARFPFMQWLNHYNKQDLKADFIAATVVVTLLIPQAMAYALIAGLPPIMGLYASIFPIILYALLGSSPTLSVGPVAILCMMTFSFLNPLFPIGSLEYLQAACLLALLTGGISLLLGICRFGFLIQLISHPVIQSFIIASSLLIVIGQLRFLFDIPIKSANLVDFLSSFSVHITQINPYTTLTGLISIIALIYIPKLLRPTTFNTFSKIVPLFLIIFTIIAHQYIAQSFHIKIPSVGEIPSGLPDFSFPIWNWHLIQQLLLPAFLIAMINFVESISIAEATALQARKNLNSNQELIAIGVSNLGAGLTMGFPVGGSLSRTVVNANSGAQTPIAGLFLGGLIIIISLFFTQVFYYLPLSVLAATIIVSIWKLVSFKPFINTWKYSKRDGIAMLVTFLTVILVDISTGLMIGVISTFILLLWKMSRPHIVVIGLVPNTQHFRNVQRYNVLTSPQILSLRIDESLTFLNAHSLKQYIIQEVSKNNQLHHVILNCSSISDIDFSALEMLEEMNYDLIKLDIQLHLSEVKSPVMDMLKRVNFIQHLNGQIFLTHYQAVKQLSQDDVQKDFMI